LAAIMVFLIAIAFGYMKYEQRLTDADNYADLDAQILSDELPPSALIDNGFAHFLTHKESEAKIPD